MAHGVVPFVPGHLVSCFISGCAPDHSLRRRYSATHVLAVWVSAGVELNDTSVGRLELFGPSVAACMTDDAKCNVDDV
jgi:hypothetical protein